MITVFVTGAGALLGQGIIRSLRDAREPYRIIAADPDPRSVGLYWADTTRLIPLAASPDYLDAIRRILAEERPDAVLIGTDVELKIFAEHRASIEAEFNTHVIVSPPEVVAIADDKWLTYEFLKTNGFPHPRSTLADGLSAFLRECPFPLIVKPRVGARSVGVSLVRNERELEAALPLAPNPIVQECVATADHEYTSGVVVFDGRVRAVVSMRRDLRDGNTYRAYVTPDAVFDDQLAGIAAKLGGYGPLNFQFRVADGVPKIFEINGRFSGTTPLRAVAGFNEVDAIVRHLVLGEPIPPPNLRPCTILRYWSETVIEPEQLAAVKDGRS